VTVRVSGILAALACRGLQQIAVLLQARVDIGLKSRRLTSYDNLARRHSASGDVELRHNRRHHGDERDVTASRTRQERERLGLRDKLDELRLHDSDLHKSHNAQSHHSLTSSDVTVTPPRRSTLPGLLTSLSKEVEMTAADDEDAKPVCAVKSSSDDRDVKVTSKSSSLTSHLCSAADAARTDLSTPGMLSVFITTRHHHHHHHHQR